MKSIQTLLALVGLVILAACTPTNLPATLPNGSGTEIPQITLQVPTPSSTITLVPSGPCDNPLISLNVGNRWVYQSETSEGSSRRTLWVEGWDDSVGLNAIIKMETEGMGIIDQDLVTCKEGNIEDFPLFFPSMILESYLDGVFNTYYENGIYSPALSVFQESGWQMVWEARYLTEEAMCFVNTGSESVCINQSSRMQLTFETEGEYQPVTVLAGTFPEALKVEFTLRIPATITIPGQFATSAPINIRTIQWYAPFVGLLRSEVESAGIEYLANQEMPFPLVSTIELVEYSLGQ